MQLARWNKASKEGKRHAKYVAKVFFFQAETFSWWNHSELFLVHSLPTDSSLMYNAASASRVSTTQAQHLALPALFVLCGVIIGSWAGRIPALAEGVHISHAALSQVLLCGGLGAVISFPLASWLMASFGGRKTLFYSGLALLCVLVSIGLAPTVPRLMVSVLLLGVTASCFNVGVNSVAFKHEARSGRSVMSKLHGLGSAGFLAGVSLSGLMASMRIAPSTHFFIVAVPLALVLWLAYELLDADDVGEKIVKQVFSLPRGPLVLLGLLGFFGTMIEASIADWTGLYLKEHFGASEGLAPQALVAFTLMMLIARLSGDNVKSRIGAQRLVSGGAMLAAAGLIFAVLAPNAYLAVAGFALAGLGLALLFPFVYSAAGTQGPLALASVATMAYSGGLVGPPVLGAIAQGAGMQASFAFIAVLSVMIALLARKSALLK
jgi:MFS family permease